MKKLEFVNNAHLANDPVAKTKELAFRDIVFKEEYRSKKAKFGQGITWVRFLPAIKPSVYDWMMPIEIHQDINGTTFANPKTLDSNADNPFETARNWLNRHNKGALQSKDKNPNGLRLYSKRMGVSWIINAEAPEGERLRILYASLYDGSRGGTTGLGFNVKNEANARDMEPGSANVGQLLHGDITDPNAGRLVKIERNLSDKSEYASYKAGIGKNAAPVDAHLAQLTEAEVDLIVPLERIIYIPTVDEQLEILRKYIGETFFNDIFSNKSVTGFTPEVVKQIPKREEEPTAKTPVNEEPKSTEVKTSVEVEPVLEKEEATVANDEPYKAREVTSLIGKDKEGIEELLRNRHRLTKSHLDIVLESAKEFGIEVAA